MMIVDLGELATAADLFVAAVVDVVVVDDDAVAPAAGAAANDDDDDDVVVVVVHLVAEVDYYRYLHSCYLHQ